MLHNNEIITLLFLLFALGIVLLIILCISYNKLKKNNISLVALWHKQNEYMEHNLEICNKATEIAENISASLSDDTFTPSIKNYYCMCESLLENSHQGTNIEEALIFEKKKKCNQLGITFIDNIEVFPNGRMDDMDIVSLMGNLTDNAIEACLASKQDNSYIKINTSIVKNCFFIHIINSKDPSVHITSSSYNTTKQNPKAHGLGIGIIKNIVSKYNGTIKMTDFGYRFEVKITLFISES